MLGTILNSVQNWLTANELVLKEGETITVLFGIKNKLTDPDHETFLRNNCRLNFQLDTAYNRPQHNLSKGVNVFKRLGDELGQASLPHSVLFWSFQAHISHGLIVWGRAARAQDILIFL